MVIKTAFLQEDYSTAAEAWLEISDEDKKFLWRAPKSGGVFTTKEIAAFKCTEYVNARNELTGFNQGEENDNNES